MRSVAPSSGKPRMHLAAVLMLLWAGGLAAACAPAAPTANAPANAPASAPASAPKPGAAAAPPSLSPIKIGVLDDITGVGAIEGALLRISTDLVFEQTNATGGT